MNGRLVAVKGASGAESGRGARRARKAEVDPAVFSDIDLRAGRVVGVDDFPEARAPAWKLTVDFGEPVGLLRTSARVTNYAPADLEGRMVAGAINLGTKRIAGFSSEFLVLGAIGRDGTVRLLRLEDGVEPGDPIA